MVFRIFSKKPEFEAMGGEKRRTRGYGCSFVAARPM